MEIFTDPLIDVVVKFRPFTTLRQRAMEDGFLANTSIAEVLSEPSRTAYFLRMAPGIGQKSRFQIIAAVHDALESEFGTDFCVSLLDPSITSVFLAKELDQSHLDGFLKHWPHPSGYNYSGLAQMVEISFFDSPRPYRKQD